MKLIGNLKNQVEQATSKEEALNLIEQAGMELTVDELDMVAGGVDYGEGFENLTPGTSTNSHNIKDVLYTLGDHEDKD